MVTALQSAQSLGQERIPYAHQQGYVVMSRASYAVPADVVEGSIIELCCLPTDHFPVWATLDFDDLDDGTELVVNWGLLSGEFGDGISTRTLTANIVASSTVPRAAGLLTPALLAFFRIAATSGDRGFGIEIATDAATGLAGSVNMNLWYRAA